MNIVRIVLVVLGVLTSTASAQEPQCPSCGPITVVLHTAGDMLKFLKYARNDDPQRKKVLDQLMDWVVESKEYHLGISIAGSSHDVGKLLGKEGNVRLRTLLASCEAPSILNKALRSFHGEYAYSAAERELICAKILKGTDLEAVEGFDAGCRFGKYADDLRARMLGSTDRWVIYNLEQSNFGKAFFTNEEFRSLKESMR